MADDSVRSRASGRLIRKLLRAAAAVGLLATLLPMAPGTALAEDPIVLRIGVRQAGTPQAFNPMRSGAMSTLDAYLLTDVFDILIPDDMDLAAAPGIIASWDTSADGLTWTYHVQPSATWSDGTPVTAKDVVFTYEYIRNSFDPAYKGPAAPDGNDADGDGEADFPMYGNEAFLDALDGLENSRITSVTATDDKTVEIVTSAQIALPLRYNYLIPEHVYESITYAAVGEYENYDPATGLPVGSGPFIAKEFKPTEFVRLVANDTYWGGRPKVDELIYQYFSNDEALVQALKAGQIDMIPDVPPALWQTLQGDPNITAVESAGLNFQEVGFNSWDPTPERFESEGCADCPKGPTTGSMGNPWLTRPEVRTALSGLIDKQLLVDRALSGHGVPGTSIISPTVSDLFWEAPADSPASFPAYTDEAGRDAARQQAITRFQAAMAALGFADTDGDGILNAPSTPEATAFDPVRSVTFSDSGDTQVGAGLNFKLRLIVRDDAQEDKTAAELIEAWYEEAGVDVDRQLVKEDPQLYDATYPSASNMDLDMFIWRWDPVLPITDFPFNVMICEAINGASDNAYCNPEYDEAHKRFLKATSPEERSAAAREMQETIYAGGPYSVLWYISELGAYRADRWEGFVQWPGGTGEIWQGGPYGSRLSVAPLGTTQPSVAPSPSGEAPSGATPAPTASPAPAPGGSGDNTGLLVGGAVVAVVVLGAIVYLVRRRPSDDD